MKKNIWFYDIESWPNFFSVTFWDGKEKKEFIIFKDRHDAKALVDWLLSEQDLVLVGFNSNNYDNVIINYIIGNIRSISIQSADVVTGWINSLSGYIINPDDYPKEKQKIVRDLRAKTYYKYIDLLEVIREGYSTKSLKGVAINLKWHRIQDLPYLYTKTIVADEIEGIMEYNFNDVLITELIFNHLHDRLEMREILSEQFGVDLLSSADSTIAKNLFDKLYTEASGERLEDIKYKRTKRTELIIGDIVLDWVHFETPEIQEWFEALRKVRVWNIDRKELKEGYEEDEFGVRKKKKKTTAVQFDIPQLKYGGMEYTIGLGGIHSVDKPGIFEADEETILLDVDVASQYPNRIRESRIVPAHLNPDVFIPIFSDIIDTRIKKKGEGKKDKIARIIAEGLKITINTVYGLYNFAYYWLFDPLATYKVTINNQLAILMLIEKLNLANIEVISANTDGIIIKTNCKNIFKIRRIYKQWEKETGFTLEETRYSKYIRRDINNYITIKTDGEIKTKGIFIPQGGILKGYDKPIVAIALQEYFLKGIKPEEVIKTLGHEYKFVNPETPKGEIRRTDIYDYCLAQKIGGSFDDVVYSKNGEETSLQRSLRYYASTTGGSLYKVKSETDPISNETKKAYHSLLTSSGVTIFNDFIERDDYEINFDYYIEAAEKIIAKIEGRKWVDKDKLEEKIEKTLESYNKIVAAVSLLQEKGKTNLKSYKTQFDRGLKLAQELNQLIEMRDGKSE